MRAGTLRHRLIVERPEVARDDTGGEVITWVRVATVWGAIEPTGGREGLGANQILGETDTRITTRWSGAVDDLAPAWRLRHQDAPYVYDVQSVAHIALGRREVHINAKSGKTNG